MAVQIAEDESAAVGVHQNREVFAVGPVDPDRDVTARSGDYVIANVGYGFGCDWWYVTRPDYRPRLRTGHGVYRRKPRIQRVEQRRYLRIEAHAYCNAGRGAGRNGRNGRNGCRVGATRWGPSSTLRQIPIAVMRTGAVNR